MKPWPSPRSHEGNPVYYWPNPTSQPDAILFTLGFMKPRPSPRSHGPILHLERIIRMSIAEIVLIFGDFMGEWVGTSKCWKWRSFNKVTIPIPVRRNSLYDEFVASVMQSGDLDCAPSDVVISYVIHSREKVNPTIINSDISVVTYIMDADVDGFRPILRINIVERSFEGQLNSSAPPPQRPTVDNDLIDDDLNDYESDVDDTINMEDYSMHMKDFSSDSQDDEEDHETK
ncbi:hypothetical protein BC332_10331 [Capsicum chinense]|nr:hypothetical protein BC332_10331 [Capsicum chinense]